MMSTEPSQGIILQAAAKAVIIDHEGRVLIILRESAAHETNTKAGQYHLVGGRIEPGESFFDGLRREVFEEAGLTIEIGQPLLVGDGTRSLRVFLTKLSVSS